MPGRCVRALQRFVEDPLSEALIAGGIKERPAFLEVYLENNNLFYRPINADSEEKAEGLGVDDGLSLHSRQRKERSISQ